MPSWAAERTGGPTRRAVETLCVSSGYVEAVTYWVAVPIGAIALALAVFMITAGSAHDRGGWSGLHVAIAGLCSAAVTVSALALAVILFTPFIA